ncbi:response regulator [Leptospira levettii]|uniref:response regulator n=1 Tax=Leptospira levettii TaxID=2023178 RepID=UPI001EEB228C|nr:response regulator [Leptospira levettii]MCG6147682.1 response regulator [Leptospira levettii]
MKINLNKQLKVLLVEDEALLALTEKKSLELYGYTVTCAPSGEEAIDVFRKDPTIGIILMDINLGHGMEGTEAAKLILKEKDIPLIFVSSHTDKEVVTKTEGITSYGYVVKSSTITVLDASIKMALKLFRANQKLKESEEKFMKAFHFTPTPMAIHDFSNRNVFVDCNKAFESIVGYSKDEIIGKTALELGLYVNLEERNEFLNILKEQGFVRNFRNSLKTKAGKELIRYLSLSQMTISNKEHIFSVQTEAPIEFFDK